MGLQKRRHLHVLGDNHKFSSITLSEDTPFYKVLQALEYKAHLSEREVIERLGIPRSTYRSWKDGTSEPSRRIYWRKLAGVFGAQVDQLIFGFEHGGRI